MLNGLVPINQSFGSCIQLLKDFCYRYSRHVITKTGIFGNGLIPKNIFSPQNYHFVKKKREREYYRKVCKFMRNSKQKHASVTIFDR